MEDEEENSDDTGDMNIQELKTYIKVVSHRMKILLLFEYSRYEICIFVINLRIGKALNTLKIILILNSWN